MITIIIMMFLVDYLDSCFLSNLSAPLFKLNSKTCTDVFFNVHSDKEDFTFVKAGKIRNILT